MIIGNKVPFFLAALAATFDSSAAQVYDCCQSCETTLYCYGWGYEGDTYAPTVTGTAEYCKEQEYYAYWDGTTCYETGYAGKNGDCYSDSACSDTDNYAKNQPWSWCEENGYSYYHLYYGDKSCLSKDELYDKYYGKDPVIEGDPHIKTWSGKWFDYHGECDLVLLDAPEFAPETPLSVHVRSKLRYEYSYIETAALALGDDVLEVGSFGEYALNGVESANLAGAHVAGYPVYHSEISNKQHKFDVVINAVTNITMTTFKDLVAVKFTAAGEDHFAGATGIMGNYQGELVGRDGAVFEDMNAFGQEWQVTQDEPMLFRTARAPQSPQQCVLPKAGVTQKRRLGQAGISKEAAEMACSHLEGEKKENCVFDVIAVGDIDMAMAGSV